MICQSVSGDVEQQLDRARALLLGVGPHRDHRQHEQHDHAGVHEQRPDQHLVDVHAPPPMLHLICMLWRSKNDSMRVEEVAEEQREEADDDVGDRRREIRAQLLPAMARMLRMGGLRVVVAAGARGAPLLARGGRRLAAVPRWSGSGRCPRGSCASAAARAGPSRGRRWPRPARGARRARASLSTSTSTHGRRGRRSRHARARPATRRAARSRRRPAVRPPADTSSPSRAAAPSGCPACRRPPPCPC